MESAWKNQEVAQLVSITFADRKRLERGVNYQLNQASWGSRSSVKNKAEVSVVKADIQRVLPLCLFKALFSMGTLLEHLAEETLCACVWEILEWMKMHLFFFFFLNSFCSSAACLCLGCDFSLEVTALALLNWVAAQQPLTRVGGDQRNEPKIGNLSY